MASSGGKEVSIFNFAFLDIVAATIGVLLFVMVLAMINSTGRVASEALEQRLTNTLQKTQDQIADKEKWDREQDKLAGTLSNLLASGTSAGLATSNLWGQQKKLKDELTQACNNFNVTIEFVAALSNQLAQLDKAFSNTTARTSVGYRVPRLRETDKTAVAFECADNKVYLFGEKQRLNEDDYSASALVPGVALVSRKARAHGETLQEALQVNSRFQRALSRNPAQRYYAAFIVRANSYAVYRQLRDAMWKRGYDVNWEARGNDESILIGGGGGGRSHVQ